MTVEFEGSASVAVLKDTAMLEVRDIHTYYGESYILQGVSLTVGERQVVAVLGRNGVGKTTLIRSIVGFTPPRRGRILFKVLEIFERELSRLAEVLTREEGKTLGESKGELVRSRNILEYIAGEGRRLRGETLPSELASTFTYTKREPLGVVALISPWNFPVAIPIWKIAPALVCGNTVVFKPATLTPWSATVLMEIFHEAGLPAGVLNMVIGPGSTVGDELITHPAVRAVS